MITSRQRTRLLWSSVHEDCQKDCRGEDARGMIRPADRKWGCRNIDTSGCLARLLTPEHLPIKDIYLSLENLHFLCACSQVLIPAGKENKDSQDTVCCIVYVAPGILCGEGGFKG